MVGTEARWLEEHGLYQIGQDVFPLVVKPLTSLS
jgi:hypothetical protein